MQLNDLSSLQRDPDYVKCEEEALALGIIKDDPDSLLKNKDEYFKLESCKKTESLFVQWFENLPICIIPDGSGELLAVGLLKETEPELEKIDVCGRFLDKIEDVVNEATSTSVMDPFTTLFIVAAVLCSNL